MQTPGFHAASSAITPYGIIASLRHREHNKGSRDTPGLFHWDGDKHICTHTQAQTEAYALLQAMLFSRNVFKSHLIGGNAESELFSLFFLSAGGQEGNADEKYTHRHYFVLPPTPTPHMHLRFWWEFQTYFLTFSQH